MQLGKLAEKRGRNATGLMELSYASRAAGALYQQPVKMFCSISLFSFARTSNPNDSIDGVLLSVKLRKRTRAMNTNIRLMIVDDHELVRSAIKQFFELNSGVIVVDEASNGAELLTKLRAVQADVVLLDLAMPGICNAELITHVKSSYPDLPILALSMHDDAKTVLRAMRAGASGFISKNSSPATLLGAICKVASGEKYLTPEMAEYLAFSSVSPEISDIELILSERERQILPLIIEGHCIKRIANELCISDKTVSTHKAHIFAKLKVKSVAELVRHSIQNKLPF